MRDIQMMWVDLPDDIKKNAQMACVPRLYCIICKVRVAPALLNSAA